MGYKFNEDQIAVQELARLFAQKEVEPIGYDMDKNGWCQELYYKYMAALDWVMLSVQLSFMSLQKRMLDLLCLLKSVGFVQI